jgi:hypothetical protein
MKNYIITVSHPEERIWVYRLKLKLGTASVVVFTVTEDDDGNYIPRDLFYRVVRQVKVKVPTHPTMYKMIMDSLKDYLDDILKNLDDTPFTEESVGLSLVPIDINYNRNS